MMRFGKIFMVLFWLAALVNLVMPVSPPTGTALTYMAPILLLVHTLEHFFFSRRFAAMGTPLSARDRYSIIVFGGLHLMTLMKRIPQSPSGEKRRA